MSAKAWALVIGSVALAVALGAWAGVLFWRAPRLECHENRRSSAPPTLNAHEESCGRIWRDPERWDSVLLVTVSGEGGAGWTIESEGYESPALAALDGSVYAATPHGEETTLTRHRLSDGEIVWQTTLPGRPPVSTDGDYRRWLFEPWEGVLVLGVAGPRAHLLVALDRDTGASRWLVDVGWGARLSVRPGELLLTEHNIAGGAAMQTPGGWPQTIPRTTVRAVAPDGDVRWLPTPRRRVETCLAEVAREIELEEPLRRWLEADNARLDCMAAGPRTVIASRANEELMRMRVMVVAPGGEVRFKREYPDAEVTLGFDARLATGHSRSERNRSALWIEMADDFERDWVVLDTRRGIEHRVRSDESGTPMFIRQRAGFRARLRGEVEVRLGVAATELEWVRVAE